MSDPRSNEELLGVGGLLPACDCDSCVALRELARRLDAAETEVLRLRHRAQECDTDCRWCATTVSNASAALREGDPP